MIVAVTDIDVRRSTQAHVYKMMARGRTIFDSSGLYCCIPMNGKQYLIFRSLKCKLNVGLMLHLVNFND